jgi:hypothetical protein
VVRVRAPGAGMARQGGIRPARALPRPGLRRRARREPGLLPDPGGAGTLAAAAGGPARAGSDPRRRQDRSLGRGPGHDRGGVVRRHRGEREAVSVPVHQHTPEMERVLERSTGAATTVSFVPHLCPRSAGC